MSERRTYLAANIVLASCAFLIAHGIGVQNNVLFSAAVSYGINILSDLTHDLTRNLPTRRTPNAWLLDPDVRRALVKAVEKTVNYLNREAHAQITSRIDREIIRSVLLDLHKHVDLALDLQRDDTFISQIATDPDNALRDLLREYLQEEEEVLVSFVQDRFPVQLKRFFIEELKSDSRVLAAFAAISLEELRDELQKIEGVNARQSQQLTELKHAIDTIDLVQWSKLIEAQLDDAQTEYSKLLAEEADRIISEVAERLDGIELAKEYSIVRSTILAESDGAGRPRYYIGREPKWDDIARGRDFKRDLQDEVLTAVRSFPNTPVFLLISGPPASGKSSLLKRIALELARHGELVLFHRPSRDSLTASLLEQIYSKIGKRIYVCIDDVFRKTNVHGFLVEIADMALPIALIATCKTSESEETRANLEQLTDPGAFGLGQLSDDEIDRLLLKLHESKELAVDLKLLPQLRNVLRGEPQLLTVMSRLVADAEPEVMVRQELQSLAGSDNQQPTVLLAAYRYVCALYRVGVPMPISLLRKVVGIADIYGMVLNRKALTGLVEYVDPARSDTVRARHEFVAELVARESWKGDAQIVDVYKLIVSTVEANNPSERRVVTSLLKNLSGQRNLGLSLALRLVSEIPSSIIDSLLENAEAPELLGEWVDILGALGADELKAKCIQTCLRRFPENSTAHLNYGRFLDEAGRSNEASEELQTAIELGLSDIPAANSYAAFLIDVGRLDDASSLLEAALSEVAGRPGEEYLLSTFARLKMAQGDVEAAEKYYKAAIVGHPNDSYARATYARFLWRVGRQSEVFDQLTEALRGQPTNTAVLSFMVSYARKTNRVDWAISRLEETLKEYPRSILARQLLITLYTQEGRTSEALAHAQVAVIIHPMNFSLRQRYARLLADADQVEKAVEQLEIGLGLADGDVSDLLLLTRLYAKLKNTSLGRFNRQVVQAWKRRILGDEFIGAVPLMMTPDDLGLITDAETPQKDIGSRLFQVARFLQRADIDSAKHLLEEPSESVQDEHLRRRALVGILIEEDTATSLEEAERLIDESTKIWPTAKWPRFLRLKLLKESGRLQELGNEGISLATSFPNYLHERLRDIDKLVLEGETDVAKQELEGLLEFAPRDPGTRTKYISLIQYADPEGAERQTAILLTQNPANIGARRRLIRLLINRGATELASEHREYLAKNSVWSINEYISHSTTTSKWDGMDQDALLEMLTANPVSTSLVSSYVKRVEAEGNLVEAISTIKRAIAVHDPPRPSLRRLMADFLERHGDIEGAEAAYKQAIAEHPLNRHNYILYAIFLQRNGLDPGKVVELGKSQAGVSLNGKNLTRLASLSFETGDLPVADHLFKLALLAGDRDAVTHLNYALFCAATSNRDNADRHFREAVRLDPNYTDAYQAFALFLGDSFETGFSASSMSEARNIFENMLARYPRNIAIVSGYARLLSQSWAQADLTRAAKLFEQALEIDKGHLQSSFSFARLLRKQGQYDRAVSIIRPYTARAQPDSKALHLLGTIFSEWAVASKRARNQEEADVHFREAEEAFQAAFIRMPTKHGERLQNARVHNGLANLYAGVQRSVFKAFYHFEEALKIENPEMPSRDTQFHLLLTHKGYAEFLCGFRDRFGNNRLETAIKEYESALQLDSRDLHVLNSYANCLLRHHRHELAITQAKAALAIDSENIRALHSVAKALFLLGDFSQAQQFFTKAMQAEPNNTYVLYSYAEALLEQDLGLLKLGLLDETEHIVRKLTNLLPGDPRIAKLNSELQSLKDWANG